MDKAIFLPTAIIGLTLIALHLFVCLFKKKSFPHQMITRSVLNASGIVGGGLLTACTFSPDLKKYLINIDIYIFIAGLVVIAVSLQSIINDFKGH